MNDIIKICVKHGNLKLNQVIKQGQKKEIVKYRCKQCMSEAHKKHYIKNKDKVLKAHKKYQMKDPEKSKEMKNFSKRKQYALNPKKYLEKTKE